MSASPSLVKIASTSASSSTATYKEELAEATTLDYDLIPVFLTAPGSTVSHSAFTAINTARVNQKRSKKMRLQLVNLPELSFNRREESMESWSGSSSSSSSPMTSPLPTPLRSRQCFLYMQPNVKLQRHDSGYEDLSSLSTSEQTKQYHATPSPTRMSRTSLQSIAMGGRTRSTSITSSGSVSSDEGEFFAEQDSEDLTVQDDLSESTFGAEVQQNALHLDLPLCATAPEEAYDWDQEDLSPSELMTLCTPMSRLPSAGVERNSVRPDTLSSVDDATTKTAKMSTAGRRSVGSNDALLSPPSRKSLAWWRKSSV